MHQVYCVDFMNRGLSSRYKDKELTSHTWIIIYITANSRSGSPTSRISYLTHTQKDPMTPRSQRRSGVTRSQGTSREGSPNRLHMQPGNI